MVRPSLPLLILSKSGTPSLSNQSCYPCWPQGIRWSESPTMVYCALISVYTALTTSTISTKTIHLTVYDQNPLRNAKRPRKTTELGHTGMVYQKVVLLSFLIKFLVKKKERKEEREKATKTFEQHLANPGIKAWVCTWLLEN